MQILPDWEQAICRDEKYDSDIWFEESDKERKSEAKAHCNRCPLQAQCLEYAMLNNITHGIWGGVTASVRYRMRVYKFDKVGTRDASRPIIIDSRKSVDYVAGSNVWFKKEAINGKKKAHGHKG